MALDADSLLDRIYLKERVARWRNIAFFAMAIIAVIGFTSFEDVSIEKEYIARIGISGVVTDSLKLEETLNKVEESDNIKAVIVRLDTPGGTAVAGEEIHLRLRQIAEKKPVIAVMRTICASAGYMVASAADHIVAREGSLTGSIGVIVQSVEVTELAKKWGIKPITIKSADLKAVPSPTETLGSKGRNMLEEVVGSYYQNFLDMVIELRELSDSSIIKDIKTGRIYTGSQALKVGLIDAIGGEPEALEWLAKNHQIDTDTKVKSIWPPRKKPSLFQQLNSQVENFLTTKLPVPLDGLMLIWQGAETE